MRAPWEPATAEEATTSCARTAGRQQIVLRQPGARALAEDVRSGQLEDFGDPAWASDPVTGETAARSCPQTQVMLRRQPHQMDYVPKRREGPEGPLWGFFGGLWGFLALPSDVRGNRVENVPAEAVRNVLGMRAYWDILGTCWALGDLRVGAFSGVLHGRAGNAS